MIWIFHPMIETESDPNFYRKRPTSSDAHSAALLDPTPDDSSPSAAQPGLRLSSKAFKAARNCDAQTWHVIQRTQALPPSSFAKSYFNDGNKWEAELLSDEQRTGWITRFNQTFKEALTANAAFKNLAGPANGSFANWRANSLQTIETIRRHMDHDPTQALILAQVSLIPFHELSPETQLTQNGIADLIIWTGQQWYLCDIKLSETAMLEHGAQVKLYRDLLESLLQGSELPSAMAPEGFVLHCANGFPYASNLPDERKAEALQVANIVPFSYEDLEADYQMLLETIERYRHKPPCPEPFFQKHCAECGYRADCYPKLLTADTLSISLLPVATSRAKALYASGIKTLEEFIAHATSESPPAVIDEISGNLPAIREALLAKAEKTRAQHGYSNWTIPHAWVAKVILFARVPNQGSVWMDADGQTYDAPPHKAILITYTEVERRIALAIAIKADAQPSLSFALQEEIQTKIHFPLPGWTLHEVAAWAQHMQAHQFNARFMANWQYTDTDEQARLPCPDSRADALCTVWNTLLQLQASES